MTLKMRWFQSLVIGAAILIHSPSVGICASPGDQCQRLLAASERTLKSLWPFNATVSGREPKALVVNAADFELRPASDHHLPEPTFNEAPDYSSDLLEQFKRDLQWIESELFSQNGEGMLGELFSTNTPVTLTHSFTHLPGLAEKQKSPFIFSVPGNFRTSSRLWVETVWNFYLMSFRKARPAFEKEIFSQRKLFPTQDFIAWTARWDLKFYYLLSVLQKLHPEFNPIEQIDPGTQFKILNYFYGEHALSRHGLNRQHLSMISSDKASSMRTLTDWLSEQYCYPLYFRQSFRCAIKGVAIYFLIQNAISLSLPLDEVVAKTEDTFHGVLELQQLSQSEDLINQRFQEHLLRNQ